MNLLLHYGLTQGKEFMDEGKERYIKRQKEREKKALSRLGMKYKMELRPTNKSIEEWQDKYEKVQIPAFI